MSNQALREGLKNIEDATEIIKFVKHPSEYGQGIIQVILKALWKVTEGLSPSGVRVFLAYVANQNELGVVRIKGSTLAEMCHISLRSYYTAKKELLEWGLIYVVSNHHSSDPDIVYVGDFVKLIFPILNEQIFPMESNRQNFPMLDSFSLLHTNANAQGKGSLPKEREEPSSLVVPSSLTTSSLHQKIQKESARRDRHERDIPEGEYATGYEPMSLEEQLAEAFADKAEATVPYSVPLGKPFRLTPQKIRVTRIPKSKRPFQKLPPELLDKMLKLCYGVKTTKQYMTLSKREIGYCSDAVIKLIGAGADLTRLDDFEAWWWSWPERTTSPSPSSVVTNWWKSMEANERKVTKNGVGTASTKSSQGLSHLTEEQISEGLRKINEQREKRYERG